MRSQNIAAVMLPSTTSCHALRCAVASPLTAAENSSGMAGGSFSSSSVAITVMTFDAAQHVGHFLLVQSCTDIVFLHHWMAHLAS